MSTLSPGSSAKPKLPTQISPVPGTATSSRTTALSDTERHQSTASVNRSGPSVSKRAASPQATMPSPRRSQAAGLSGGSRSTRSRGSPVDDVTSAVRATSLGAATSAVGVGLLTQAAYGGPAFRPVSGPVRGNHDAPQDQ